MKRALCLFGAALMLAAQAFAFPPKGDLATATLRRLDHDGVARSFLSYRPPHASQPPLVILLHGGTQSARDVWTQTSLPYLAAREGFMLVAPDAREGHWNDGRAADAFGRPLPDSDDVAFLARLIEHVVAQDGARADAVFLAGVSNGGMMTMRFVCARARLLRGAASVIANMPLPIAAECKPGRALPWLQFNATADPIVPFEGGERRGGTEVLSADDTFTLFARNAGCTGALSLSVLPKRDATDPTRAERRSFPSCAPPGAQFFVLRDGGHVWPNTVQRSLGRSIFGRSNQDIDPGEEIWGFFAATLN